MKRPTPVRTPRKRRTPTSIGMEMVLGNALRAPAPVSPFEISSVSQPAPGVVPPGTQIAMDSYGFNIGNGLDWASAQLIQGIAHEAVSFLGYPYLAQLAQRPEYRRMTETIARHMTRKWIKFSSKGGEDGKGPDTPDVSEPTGIEGEAPPALSAASRAGFNPRIKKLGNLMHRLSKTRESEDGEAAPGHNGGPGLEDKAEKIKIIEQELERLKVKDVFRKALEQDGYFGRGHIFVDLGTTDRDELKMSIGDGQDTLSRTKIAKGTPIRAIKAIEAVWCYPSSYNATNPLDDNWYRPDRWFVMGKEVHASRLLTIVSREVPDMLKPAYMFGGLSLSQIAKPYVDNWLKTRESVSKIISAFSVFVLKTNVLEQMMDEQSASQLHKRLMTFNAHRDNTGVMAVDKDAEDFMNVSTSLGTLDALQAQTQEHMAAVSGIPLIELLGIQPAGLNASSEGEIETFYDWIHSGQESDCREPLTRIVNMIQLSKFGEIDEDIVFEFEKLRTMDERETAEIQKLKIDMFLGLIDAAVISADEVRELLADDDDLPFHSLDLTAPAPEPQSEGPPGADPFGGPPGAGGGDPSGFGAEPPQPDDAPAAGKVSSVHVKLGSDEAKFEESKHPRAPDGKFGTKGAAATKPAGKGKEAEGIKTAPAGKKPASEAPSAKGEGSKESQTTGSHTDAASKLYAKHAANAPATKEGRIARGAEIAAELGVTKEVAEARHKCDTGTSTDAPVSAGGHVQEDGTYTPARQALHDKLIDEIFTSEAIRNALPAPGEKPMMTVLGGRGGSGKSWLTGAEGPVDINKTIVVDADHFKSRLPEYEGWNAGLCHEESSYLVDKCAEIAAKRRCNITFDATLKSESSAAGRIAQFQAEGYEVQGFYMFCSPETATKRALGRFKHGMQKDGKGRFVPPEIVMSNTENEKNFDKIVPSLKRWAVYDNNEDGGSPKHVAGNIHG